MMFEHAKEPWQFVDREDEEFPLAITGETPPCEFGGLVALVKRDNYAGVEEKNARRIVACVNACAGIPTEELDKATSMNDADRLRRLAGEAAVAARLLR